MLDSSRVVAGMVSEASPNVEMKAKGRSETLDNLIKQTLTNDSFLSFSKAEKSPVQWFHLLDTLDQQNMNQDLSSSKLDSALDRKGHGPEEVIETDSKVEESSAPKSFGAKGGNLFGRGLQNGGDKFSSLKLPEAMVAIAQAAKDLPGWPLMSSKMTMHKCEKCSQEFSSPVNHRRHMRATHRRPLKGDKEDLKKKKEQIGIFWDKLTVEKSLEILSFKNLSRGELSAVSIVQALTTHLQQPGLLSLPQAYIKVAMLLLDIVQGKSARYPLSSRDLFIILEDASENNMLYGVTSSSMQRSIFGSEPGRVGLETKNLAATLGFLIELRLVQAWMDDKDAEALRCQNALVEEEEAAQKKQAKLQERKRQKKIRQRELKDKDKKALESSTCVQELKRDFLSHKEEDSPIATNPSSGFLGADISPNEASDAALPDTGGANHSKFSSSLSKEEQFRYPDNQENFDSQNASLDQRRDSSKMITQFRPTNEYGVVGGGGWKERRHGDYSYSFSHLKYGVSNHRKVFEHQSEDQWLKKPHTTNGSSAQLSTSKYREKFPVMKRPISMGSSHAIWTKKVPQISDAFMHDENGESAVSEMLSEAPETAAGNLEENTWLVNPGKSEVQNRESSLSLNSITSHSSSSRIGADDQENQGGRSTSPETSVGGKVGSNSLVIGSVTIPFGDLWSGSSVDAKLVRESEGSYQPGEVVMQCDELSPKDVPVGFTPAASSAEAAQQSSKTHSDVTSRETPVSWKDAPPYLPLSESSIMSKDHAPTLLNKPGAIKVWRPITGPITGHSDILIASSNGVVSSGEQELGGAVIPTVCKEGAESDLPVQSQFSILGAENGSIDTFYTGLEGFKNDTSDARLDFASNKTFSKQPAVTPGQAVCEFVPLRGDIASLLHQRWDDAISSADAIYHQEWE